MKIGLIDVDSHAKIKKWGATIYPNLALCKISAYHKQLGDEVTWYDPMFTGHCDKVYMSKIFNFSTDYQYPIDADMIVRGGTGYTITGKLNKEIDDCQPDYSIYPTVPKDISYGFLTRGCPNKCPWCVVPIKEGAVQPYWDIEKVADGKSKVVLMDNNILASGEYGKQQLKRVIDLGLKIDFNQAMDARLVTEDWADLLSKVRWIDGMIRFGCDTTAQIEHCQRAMDMINDRGFHGQYFLYTMIGGKNGLEECYSRIAYWRDVCLKRRRNKEGRNVLPYAQPYRDPYDNHQIVPQWQKDMAQWCNKHMIFVKCDFKDFEPRKGFKCSKYFEQ